ncbi:MAG: helix-turn-helix domain-containing protein [Desulfurococcaceae archaeon]
MGSDISETAEYIVNIMRNAGYVADTISYPSKNRSIDIVAYSNSKRVFLKTINNAEELSGAEIRDLKKIDAIYTAKVVIVANMDNKKKLEDDVVYCKSGINMVTPQTLENYVLKGEKPFIANIRGNYVLKIDPRKFQEKRRELNLTRGEIASILGLSRKSIYLYEHGEMMVSLNRALKLAELLGEDMFCEFDIFSENVGEEHRYSSIESTMDIPEDNIEQFLWNIARRFNYMFVKLSRTPMDIVIKGNKSLVIVKEGRNMEKIENAEKIAKAMSSRLISISSLKDLEKIKNIIISELSADDKK